MSGAISNFRLTGLKDIKEITTRLDRFHDQLVTQVNPILKTSFPVWTYVGVGQAPVFQNGWTNKGKPFPAARFYKDSNNIVHLSGIITGGTVAFGTTGTAFTLPPGFRPAFALVFAVNSNSLSGEVRIGQYDAPVNSQAGGGVVMTSGSNAFFCLDGISFLAEQ